MKTTILVASALAILSIAHAAVGSPAKAPAKTGKQVHDFLVLAIDRGAPLYNDGSPAACAAVYEVAARAALDLADGKLSAADRAVLTTAVTQAARIPRDGAERTSIIADFLNRARSELRPLGCGVSAAIFGIVTASIGDEGIGQTVDSVSPVVDAISPMLYPSHYSPGWIGFDDPNDHPGPVIAHALDSAAGKVAEGTVVRPWIQGFYYNAGQVQAQINEAEKRGAGWIIWNASGSYGESWLPSSEPDS